MRQFWDTGISSDFSKQQLYLATARGIGSKGLSALVPLTGTRVMDIS
jgi:hypothetical protein